MAERIRIEMPKDQADKLAEAIRTGNIPSGGLSLPNGYDVRQVPVADLDPLSLRVAEVVRQRDELAQLLGELLATIELPNNRVHMHPFLLGQAARTREKVELLLPLKADWSGATSPREDVQAEAERIKKASQQFDGSTGLQAPTLVIRERGAEGRKESGNG